MSGFKDREDHFEMRHAHAGTVDFKIEARCSKLFGLWAAEQLGLEGADAKTYAGEVVTANLDEPGFQDIIRKVKADFEAKELEISDHLIDARIEACQKEAKKQILDEQEED